jgi:hypothetical protein
MPFILETVVATCNPDGSHHIAPYGLIQDGADWILAAFRPSPAIENLQRVPYAVASSPCDPRVIAGAVTGRRQWPTELAEKVPGVRLRDAFGHLELEVAAIQDDATRPRFRCRVVHAASHRPFVGYNRAQAAIIETAILVTRLHMLPREKIEAEIAYLAIAVSKTAGAAEAEAWEWLTEKVRAYYGAAPAA